MNQFDHAHFDYIVIDETHRASAASYQKILNYFKPKFLLGMTATPERTDGLDVFKIFDFNIAFEIRLHDALEQEMLVPFHYYGISDIEVNGNLLDDKATIHDLNRLDRVNHIIEKINLFGTDDGVTRGLVFCSRQEECKYLSDHFNNAGFKTLALTGSSSDDERSRAIDLLETDDLEIKLDYIFSVDIFNEGIDIPRVNQIVMLRPTQSAIIFVQQLGRGLRKREGKSYVTVIDFIGNYQNNFLVPVALFGDNSFSKENLRKLVNRPEQSIIGASTIYFDRVVKEKIFNSIDNGNLQQKRQLKEDYFLLKGKIGRIPNFTDFINHGERDPYQYIKVYGSYYSFLISINEVNPLLTKNQEELINFISKEVLNPIRFIDVHLFKTVLLANEISLSEYEKLFQIETNIKLESIDHSLLVINGLFHTINVDRKLVKVGLHRNYEIIKFVNSKLFLGSTLLELINSDFIKNTLLDLCDYSLRNLQKSVNEITINDFSLNKRYTRKDVFRILKWDENPVAQNVGGYMIAASKNDCAIFVNYQKDDEISATTKYHDRFASKNEFIWMSKSKRKISSPDVSTLINQKQNCIRIPLFVKKSNAEGSDFYYLGNVKYKEDSAIEKQIPDDNGKLVSVVEMNFILDSPVEKSLYDYIINSN